MRKLEESLPLQLLKARETAMSYFRPLLQNHDVTEQQWRVIRALAAEGELDYKELAKKCCILSPSLTGIITRLEKQNYISRRKDEKDNRRIILSLSDKSHELITQMSPEIEAIYQEFTDQYGKKKLDQLFKLLSDLIKLKE